MLSDQKLSRLNDLARKAKTGSLTDEEREEQRNLRDEYLTNFRKGFRQQLDHIHVDDQD